MKIYNDNVQVAEEEEDRCDQAEDKKPPTEEVTETDDEKIKTDDDEKIKTDKDDEKIKTDKPVQECEEPSPPCEFSWYATQWSQCSSKCAGMMGLQTRLEDDDMDIKLIKMMMSIVVVVEAVDAAILAQIYSQDCVLRNN